MLFRSIEIGSEFTKLCGLPLLCESRNVISCIPIHPAGVVEPFQAFVTPTVVPGKDTEISKHTMNTGFPHTNLIHYMIHYDHTTPWIICVLEKSV